MSIHGTKTLAHIICCDDGHVDGDYSWIYVYDRNNNGGSLLSEGIPKKPDGYQTDPENCLRNIIRNLNRAQRLY